VIIGHVALWVFWENKPGAFAATILIGLGWLCAGHYILVYKSWILIILRRSQVCWWISMVEPAFKLGEGFFLLLLSLLLWVVTGCLVAFLGAWFSYTHIIRSTLDRVGVRLHTLIVVSLLSLSWYLLVHFLNVLALLREINMFLVLIGLALTGFLGGFSGGITGYYIRKYVTPWLKERASDHT
jgi:hypothetical protein